MSIQTNPGPGAHVAGATGARRHLEHSRDTASRRGATVNPVLPLWAALAAALVGGLALDAAFPSLGWWPLAFLAVPLALLALIGRRLWGSVLVGAVYGAAFFFPHVSWASQFLGDHPLGWVPWVALAGAEALLMATLSPLITLAYRWLPRWRDTGVVRLVVLPFLVAGAWMVRELVMGSWPYGGFPWGRVGMSQSQSPLAEVASWVGVSGLGFLMVALCAAAIEAGRRFRRGPGDIRAARTPSGARWGAPLLPSTLLAGLLLLLPQFPTEPAGTMRVGAAQGDGPAAYVDERRPGEVLDSQLAASEPLRDEQVDIVLWPEGGVDSDPLANEATARTLSDASRRYGAPILLNAASAHHDALYNTSLLWTEEGFTASHSKHHPVPFGEYVPHRDLYGAIAPSLVNLLQREYAHGTDTPAVDVDGTRVGLAICFDVIFDDVIQAGAHSGAQVYMFQTNNADFRGTDENLQQLAVARMRAIETGRSVVNLSTSGTSQVFAPDGATVASLPVDEPGLMVTDVELRDGLTAGVVLGPWVEHLVLWGTLLVLVSLALATRRSPTPAGSPSSPRNSPRDGRRSAAAGSVGTV